MKHEDVKQFESAIRTGMSRKERLLRWAMLIDVHSKCGRHLRSLQRVEYLSAEELRAYGHTADCYAGDQRMWYGEWAGTVAFQDPLFATLGLKSGSCWDVVEFFGLRMCELHAISCDCKGIVTNHMMVCEIRRAANAGPISRFRGAVWRWMRNKFAS